MILTLHELGGGPQSKWLWENNGELCAKFRIIFKKPQIKRVLLLWGRKSPVFRLGTP